MKPQTNVLLIEDTESDAELVRSYLEDTPEEGAYNVIHAPDMETAIQTMEKIKIHAVMLDLFLPDTEELSGLDSVKSILPSAPVLILTGRDDEEYASRAVETGAQDYLVKDHISPTLLRRSLRYAIQRKKYEDKITYQANYDPLTGLPNRESFKEKLEIALARQQRTKHTLIVILLDLDGFKSVNDTYGHETGDKVLREAAKRMKESLRPYDTAARYGGDEFLILIEGIDRMDYVESVARKLIETLARPIIEPMREIRIGASLGIAFSRPDENLSVDILIRRADQAMYETKQKGKNGYRLFQEGKTFDKRQRNLET